MTTTATSPDQTARLARGKAEREERARLAEDLLWLAKLPDGAPEILWWLKESGPMSFDDLVQRRFARLKAHEQRLRDRGLLRDRDDDWVPQGMDRAASGVVYDLYHVERALTYDDGAYTLRGFEEALTIYRRLLQRGKWLLPLEPSPRA